MLVVSNGAFKSGSTWLFHIIREMTGFGAVPERYRNPDWKHPSIHPAKLAELLEGLDYSSEDYLVKNHFDRPKQHALLLSKPDIRVINIQRDLRDVVVSAYYHLHNFRGYDSSFQCYYWTRGRRIADSVCRYHALWTPLPGRVYASSFERLKTSFHDECRALAAFLGVAISEQKVMEIKRSTSIEVKRRKQQSSGGARNSFVVVGSVTGSNTSPRGWSMISNGLNGRDCHRLLGGCV